MPRERIQHGKQYIWKERDVSPGETPSSETSASQEYLPGMELPEGSLIREESSLDLTWNRDGGWVQLGLNAPRDWWERFFASYENSPEQHEFSAWTNVLTRVEINNLIRTLRRARDAAYGADE
jgi:hypothetical protein